MEDQKDCTIFIHTDPFMWRHLVVKNQEPRYLALVPFTDLRGEVLHKREA